jgi:hypothetical protein
MTHEWNRENQIRTELYVNRMERAKVSISPMPGCNHGILTEGKGSVLMNNVSNIFNIKRT